MTFQEHICDSRCGFTVLFESTAKPQREGQKCLLEGTKMHFTLFLQWFSECPHKKYYKTVLIWAWARRGPKYVAKTWFERPEAPHRSGKQVLGIIGSKCEPGGGGRHKPWKTKRLSDMSAESPRLDFRRTWPGTTHRGRDDDSLTSKTPSNYFSVKVFFSVKAFFSAKVFFSVEPRGDTAKQEPKQEPTQAKQAN